jgi:hypothetical protein
MGGGSLRHGGSISRFSWSRAFMGEENPVEQIRTEAHAKHYKEEKAKKWEAKPILTISLLKHTRKNTHTQTKKLARIKRILSLRNCTFFNPFLLSPQLYRLLAYKYIYQDVFVCSHRSVQSGTITRNASRANTKYIETPPSPQRI